MGPLRKLLNRSRSYRFIASVFAEHARAVRSGSLPVAVGSVFALLVLSGCLGLLAAAAVGAVWFGRGLELGLLAIVLGYFVLLEFSLRRMERRGLPRRTENRAKKTDRLT